MRRSVCVALVLLASGACAEDINPPDDDEGGSQSDGADPGPPEDLQVVDNEDGTSTLTVNATDYDNWVYLSLSALELMEPDEPAVSADWDLGLRRFQYALDGGVSGAGQGALMVVDGATLADVTEAPAEGWLTDTEDDPADVDTNPQYAFETAEDGWYDYDAMTHILTPKLRVYVVRGGAGDLFALSIDGYYNDAGTAGWSRFTVKALAAP